MPHAGVLPFPQGFSKTPPPQDGKETLAAEKGCTPSPLAIAGLLAQGEDVITIPRTKRTKYLEENIALEKVKLTAYGLQSIEAIMPAGIYQATVIPKCL